MRKNMPGTAGGVYTVIAELIQSREIQIGKKRNNQFFTKGFYAYVGSALNGLVKRLERHLGNRRNMHWHIDYLLENAAVREILFTATDENLECSIARSLSAKLPAVPGFGCSDCRCRSHLFYNPDMQNLVTEVTNSIQHNNLVVLTKVSDLTGGHDGFKAGR
jgi:Uri superfamily endonuclease